MVGNLNFTISRIGNYYNQSKGAISSSLEILSSGIKYRSPKDGVPEFMQVERLKQDKRGYDKIEEGLKSTAALVSTAESIGNEIINNFAQMKKLTFDYWEAPSGSTERTEIEKEFNNLASNIITIQNNAYFDGKNLMQNGTVVSVMLNPNDYSQTLDISYAADDIADTSTLTISGGVDYSSSLALVDAEMNKAMSYMAKTSGYVNSVSSQLAVAQTIKENTMAMESSINSVDDADEMNRFITNDIRQQASVSMLSQANMIKGSILKLIE